MKIGFTHDVFVTVPKGVADKMKPVLERKDPLVAPIALNSRVGTLKMMVDGKPLTRIAGGGAGAGESGQHLRPRVGFSAAVDEIKQR